MSNILVNLISFYQKYLSFDTGVLSILAPGGSCKFEISCSEYTKRAIKDYGAAKGVLMGVKRVWRCR